MPWPGGSSGLSTLAAVGSQHDRKGLRKAQWRRSQVRLEEGGRVKGQQCPIFGCSLKPGLCSPLLPFPVFSPSVNQSFNQLSPACSPHLPFLLTTFPSTMSRSLSLLASCPRKNSSKTFPGPQTRLTQIGGLQNFLYLCTHTFLTLFFPT